MLLGHMQHHEVSGVTFYLLLVWSDGFTFGLHVVYKPDEMAECNAQGLLCCKTELQWHKFVQVSLACRPILATVHT